MIIQFTFIYFDQLKDYFLTSTISTGLQNEILVTKQEYATMNFLIFFPQQLVLFYADRSSGLTQQIY